MRAAVATGSSIEVRDDVADPTPGPGQVLVHKIVCGICGSDLHALAAPEEMAQLNANGGAAAAVNRRAKVVVVMVFSLLLAAPCGLRSPTRSDQPPGISHFPKQAFGPSPEGG